MGPQACSFKLCVHIYPAPQMFMWYHGGCWRHRESKPAWPKEDAGDTEKTNQHGPGRMLETQRANQHGPTTGRMLETEQTRMAQGRCWRHRQQAITPPGSSVLLPSDEPESPTESLVLALTFLLQIPFVSLTCQISGNPD